MRNQPAYKCSWCGVPRRSEGVCVGWPMEFSGVKFCAAGFQLEVTPFPACTSKVTDRNPTRHCSACGIGTCDEGKSECGRCEPKPDIKDGIIRALRETCRKLGAKSDLLGTICSYGDTLTDSEVLDGIREWNSCEPQKPEPMTLERAAEILRRNKHSGRIDWQAWNRHGYSGVEAFVFAGSAFTMIQQSYSEFVSIAIAEKYLREGK